jgi:hypothetical protein
MPPRRRADAPGPVQGARSIAGEILRRESTAGLDPRLRALVERQLGSVLPGRLVPAGQAVEERRVNGDDVIRLLRSAAVTAGGLDPARTTDPPPPLLWEDGPNRLLVRIADLNGRLDEGLIELVIPVFCEETGEAEVTVTFITESREQPTGGICITEDHPRGPAVIVENWHEPLIALAWHTVLIATGALSGAIGADESGQQLVSATLSVSREGIAVTPMARHTFLRAMNTR